MSCIYKDWNLTKSATVDGKSVTSSTNIAPGAVVTYTAAITQMYGVDAIDALPLVDRMQGGQILLVPVLNNAALRNRGLETTTVGKLQYYILNQPGTYEKVTIGGYLTDHVEVTASASGLDTRIYWYLHMKKNQRDGSQNYFVTYYSLVDPNKAGLENSDARYTLTNKVWLGDDETHRLYDICYLYGYILQIGKNIVTNAEDSLTTEHNPDKDELAKQTVIDEGEKVTYRLMIGAIGDSKVTIPGSAIYDTLPGSIGNYWSEDNISITYVPTAGSTCTVTGGDSWYIENDAKNTTGKTQQTIRWGSDFRAQVEGTLYIYVTLQFPKDTENSKVWEQYAEIYGGDGLTNTWHVYDLTDSVYHVLKIPAQVKLQKGVVDSGNSSEEDSLLYYSNSSYYKNTVTYYVSVYNSGKSRVYLSKIQDVLPEGFTFNSLYNCDYSAYASSNAKYYNSLVTIKNGSAKATYKSAAVSVGTKTVNGREVVTFNLSNSYRASSTRTLTGSISYDQTQSRCYLLPGEAVVIAYSCYTNKYEDTEDVANNVVTMDYYDYAGAGMTADQDSTIELNNTTKIHNDGDFEICSTEEMAALGVDTTGKSDGTSWLTSEVSLQRGKIVPGIQKACMVEQASTTETIGWTVTGYNSGNGALRDYTYTDIMMYPYQFTGTVSYKISQETAKGSSSVKANLFQIIDRDEQSVTIQYSTSYEGSRYNTTPTVVMQMDGDPVTISSYYFGLIDVSIGHDSDQNEVLSVRFKDTQYAAIPANGTGTLTVYTNNVSNLNENKIFINQCYLTPNEQEFENSEVSQGTYTTFDLPSDEDSEKKPSVVSEAQVGVSYGYATKSVKTVTELTENGKSASSNSATNYIVLSNGEDSTFRYDLEVENNGGNSLPQDMNLMVMIDNLPEVGDHTTFYKEYARYSDFQVDFADPEELNPVVTVKTADGKSKTLSSKQYTLQFSKQTDLNFADNTELWQGQAVGTKDGWYTLAELEANNLDLKDMRTFRLVIDDSEETGLMPAKSTVSFGFNAVVHKDGEKIPGASEIAWNSFGYLYQIGTLKLQAAPLNVGVKIAGVPHLVKNLVDSQKKMYVTDEDETFRFLICKGSITQINSQSTETDKMKWLTDMEIPFTVAEITVPKGSSGSDAIPLDHMKVCTYDAETGKYQETEQDWIWSDKATYTVTELLQEGEDVKYTFGNINSNKLNQYIFTFDKSTSIHLTATNIRKEWDIQLLKTDSNGKKKLSGAVFGLYSKKQTDQLAEDAALPEKLNVQPEWSITNGEDTWYLMDIQTTDQDGQILWSDLTDNEYYVLELQAPMGYRLGKDPGQVVKWTAGTEVEQVNIVNASIFQLPHAGGMGTGLFTISGLCLIAGGLLYMWLKRKRKHE
jgi:LPXTG-motif cell wall-anchored protein/uncharacterized repeat protein (TIGR01451 family)